MGFKAFPSANYYVHDLVTGFFEYVVWLSGWRIRPIRNPFNIG
jgi:hypothetical protein